jgi:hypothetical protein
MTITSSSTLKFLFLSIYSTVNPLNKLSTLLMRAMYFSKVASLVMHSFSIWFVITFECVLIMHLWTPMARSLWNPKSRASYSVMLFVHLSVSLINYNLVTYPNLIHDGELNMAAAPASTLPQAPSQYISQGDSVIWPSV